MNQFHIRSSVLSIGTAIAAGTLIAAAGASAEEISIIINQSPWYPGFEATVEQYEELTGATVNLEAVPFPVLLEKSRNSVRANEGIYDILTINSIGIMEMYAGGFLEAVSDIDPDYRLRDDVSDFGGSVYYNEDTGAIGDGGKLMALPMAGVIQLLYYRTDLYEENGLEVPKTWDQLFENAQILHNPPSRVGFTIRGSRQNIAYNAMSYIYSHQGSIFADEASGDFTITINSPNSLAGFETFLKMGIEVGPDNTGALGQAEMIQYLATGRTAHAIAVNAAWSGLEDPNRSIVAGKIGVAEIPSIEGGQHYSSTGHFIGGIPKNIPAERQRAALDFMKWLNTPDGQRAMVENGSVPVSKTLKSTDFDDPEKYRFLEATSANAANALFYAAVKERDEINAILDLYFNLAVIGDLSAAEALNKAAEELYAVMEREGYQTGLLPPL